MRNFLLNTAFGFVGGTVLSVLLNSKVQVSEQATRDLATLFITLVLLLGLCFWMFQYVKRLPGVGTVRTSLKRSFAPNKRTKRRMNRIERAFWFNVGTAILTMVVAINLFKAIG